MGISSKFIVEFFADRTTAPICIVSYANLKEEAKQFPPAEIYTRDMREVDRFVKKYDKPGRAVYFGVNPVARGKRRNKQNIAEIAALQTDLDFKTIVESRMQIEAVLARIPLLASLIVFSGNGLHCYWWISATTDQAERVETALKRLAWALAGDEKVAEIARVMRLPGSHNTKFGEWAPVEVIAKNGSAPYELEALETWLASLEEPLLHRVGEQPKGNGIGSNIWQQAGAQQARFKDRLDVDAMWDDLQYLGQGGGGNLHDTEVRIGAALLSRGEPVEEVVAYLQEQITARIPESVSWNWKEELRDIRNQCVSWFVKHPDVLGKQMDAPQWLLSDPRIQVLLEQHIKAQEEQKKAPKIEVITARELEATGEPVPVQYLVPGLFIMDALNGFFGDGATGKDLLMLQLGHAMTCNRKFLGYEVPQGRVLIFNMEDNVRELRWRQAKIMKYMEIEHASEDLWIVPMLGRETILATFDRENGKVMPTSLFTSVYALIQEFKPLLTVVGNRVNIFGVNQNDDAQARQCLNLLNNVILTLGTTIIMPGHPSMSQITSGAGSSGSVQWSNGCRQRIYLSRPKSDKDEEPDEKQRDQRILEVVKSNWGPSGEGLQLKWIDWAFKADYENFNVTEPTEQVRKQKQKQLEDEVEDECMRMISKAIAMGIRLSPQPRAHNYPATLFARNGQFTECKFRGDKGFKLLNAAIGRLFMRGRIRAQMYGSPSDQTKEIVRNDDA